MSVGSLVFIPHPRRIARALRYLAGSDDLASVSPRGPGGLEQRAQGHGRPSFLEKARLSTISVQTHSVSLHLEGDKLHHPRLVEAVMAAGAPRGQKRAVAVNLE